MISFQNAKINLGLNIVRKREDGYHDLETIFYPVPIEDILELTPLNDLPTEILERIKPQVSVVLDGKLFLLQTGNAIECPPEKNLVTKAYRILDEEFHLPPTFLSLHKQIPSGAGMGGGSANAAFVLKMLNEVYQLGLTEEILEQYASRLGADCAFFIKNRPTFAQGIGDRFSPIALNLSGYQLLIIKPNIFVSTRDAFANVHPQTPQMQLTEVIKRPVEEWKHLMTNDFEKSVFSKFPEIGNIKQQLYDAGAIYASMSGSGSSVYGIFAPEYEVPALSWPHDTFVSPCFRLKI